MIASQNVFMRLVLWTFDKPMSLCLDLQEQQRPIIEFERGTQQRAYCKPGTAAHYGTP
jgi:hypothetical protein